MNKDFEHIDIEALIAKAILGEATPEELAFLEQWKTANESNKKMFDQYVVLWKKTWQSSLRLDIDVDAEWKRMDQYIGSTQKQAPVFSIKRSFYYAAAAAAVVVIIFFGYRFYDHHFSSESVIASTISHQASLSDGTSITLNKQSKLFYPKNFTGNTREVKLQGEAFFDVAHNKENPFIIHATNLDVRVVGTSFYVNTTVDSTVVIVNSGRVAVYTPKKDTVYLNPGDKAVFAKANGRIEKMINADLNYIAWKTHVFDFDNAPLSEVIRQINKSYDCTIKISSSSLQNCRVTTTFNQLSVEQMMDILQRMLDLQIDKKDSQIELRGRGC